MEALKEEAGTLLVEILGILTKQIYLLSVGTGLNPHYIPGTEHDFGYKQWLIGDKSKGVQKGALLNMLFDGMLGPPDYMCRQLLNGRYRRIQPVLHEVIDLDETDRIDELLAIADGMDLSRTIAWIKSLPTNAFLILALDGGGIRGVLQARVLEILEAACPGFLKRVKFTAGTSIGGINACFIAKNHSVKGLVHMFREYGPEIFAKRDWLDTLAGGLDELVRANYDRDGLEKALKTVFDEDETLGDLPGKCMVVAFDLDNQDEQSVATATRRYTARHWKPKYGHNWDPDSPDSKTKVLDWLYRGSAAPTYFPGYQGYVDGGVIDNNPSAAALAKAVKEGMTLGHVELLERVAKLLDKVAHMDVPPEAPRTAV